MRDRNFELFVALRYLLARRKQAFISLISMISVIGVSVGVMALLIALALMTGLQAELRDRLVGSTAHVYVFKAGGFENLEEDIRRLRELPDVTGAAPVMLGQGLALAADREIPVTMKGVIPELEETVTEIKNRMETGSLAEVKQAEGQLPGIVLGRTLAENLGVYVGDSMQVLTTDTVLTPLGLRPRTRSFKVVGIFNLGLYEYDATYGFIHLDVAERIFADSTTMFVELKVNDMFEAQNIAESIPSKLGPEYQAQDWADMNSSLFQALWLEKMAISITIGLIVMVAALNIIASLILLVMEKSRDIAILKTMGAASASIRRIFVLQGLIIGLVGTAAGAVAGTIVIYVLDRFQLIQVPLDVYQISHVPFRLEPLDFIIVVVVAVLICFIATIYPSRQAAKLDPAQALRYQ